MVKYFWSLGYYLIGRIWSPDFSLPTLFSQKGEVDFLQLSMVQKIAPGGQSYKNYYFRKNYLLSRKTCPFVQNCREQARRLIKLLFLRVESAFWAIGLTPFVRKVFFRMATCYYNLGTNQCYNGQCEV